MKPIKIIQIGSQHDHAPMVYNSLLHLPQYFEVLALADRDPETAKARIPSAQNIITVEEALNTEGLQAVTIECEEENALDLALPFAEKGIAVHMDKPGSADHEKFIKLANILKQKNTVFTLGYMYRYNPAIKKAIDMVKKGELGEIFSVEAQMSVRHPKEKRQWLKKHRGGMMYYLGCHLIDLVLQIQGKPQEIISLNTKTFTDGVDSEDYGFALFKYKNGISFVKTNASEYNGYGRRQLVITGSKGSIEMKPLEVPKLLEGIDGDYFHTPYKLTLENNNPNQWSDSSVKYESELFERYDVMMETFAKHILGEEENPYTYDYEIELHKTLMEICK